MADDDKGIGLGEIAAGTAVGTGVVAGTAHITGKVAYSKEGLETLHKVSEAKIGDKIHIGIGGPEISLTEKMIGHAKDLKNLAPEYQEAGHLGKIGVSLKGMKTSTKFGVGALAVGAAIGTGMVINKMRGGSESHVDRLQRERTVAKNSHEI